MTTRSKAANAVILMGILIAVIVVVIAWFEFADGRSLRSVAGDLPWGVLLSISIMAICSVVMPRVWAHFGRRHSVVVWVAILSIAALCAAAGTALASVLAFVLLRVPPPLTIRMLFMQNIAGTVPVTMIICGVLSLLAAFNERLEATELSLQTQRLERERAEKLAAEAQLASLSSR